MRPEEGQKDSKLQGRTYRKGCEKDSEPIETEIAMLPSNREAGDRRLTVHEEPTVTTPVVCPVEASNRAVTFARVRLSEF